MKYNENIAVEYGESKLPPMISPVSWKPLPTEDDYNAGYINRTFAKKANEDIIFEINYEDFLNINADLYFLMSIKWKISGPRHATYKGIVMEESGVEAQNKFEIERVKKELGVDLNKALPNLLEYWRGY